MYEPASRMVALCDILGFSHLIESEPLKNIIEHYLPCFLNMLENSITQASSVGGELSISRIAQSDKVGIAWFSDTILLYALDDSDEACQKILAAAGWLLFRTFFDAPMTRVRVGVGYGEIYVNQQRDLFLGKAIVEAHKIERQQDWMGGALSKNAEARMREVMPTFPFGWWLTEYPVPMRAGRDSGLLGTFAIDWTQGDHRLFDMEWSKELSEPSPLDWEQRPDICQKWSNTRAFHREKCFWCNRNR